MSNPLTIPDIAFATGHLLQLPRIDQLQLELIAFQDVPDRLPQHSGRFHCHMRDVLLGKPVTKCQQLIGHRGEGAATLFH